MSLPEKDYVSPGFAQARPDACFPNMAIADPRTSSYPYLRRTGEHNWYCDRRAPGVGFVNRDEAHILYNTALMFHGQEALEIGCFMGWSACHLALGGVNLDVVDPLLQNPAVMASVRDSLAQSGFPGKVRLIPAASPEAVQHIARTEEKRWALVFIDGNHDAPAPLKDAALCAELCLPDAMILFHDLLSPEVAEGLRHLEALGWNTVLFHTSQIMGAAWRGNVRPVRHIPDPATGWVLPPHLAGFAVSG